MLQALLNTAIYELTESNICYNPCTMLALTPERLDALGAVIQFDSSLLVSHMHICINFGSNPDRGRKDPIL